MRLGGVVLVGTSVTDVRANDDQRRPRRLGLRRLDRTIQGGEIIDVRDVLHVPAIGLKPGTGIVAEGERGVALDRDVVVVVEADQLAELRVSGERGGFVGDAFHHVAVAGDEVDVMVYDLLVAVEHRPHVRLGHRHANRVANPLAQRSSRRLDAGSVAELGMAGRLALPLPKLLQVIECELVAGEIEHAVQQHRCVPRRQHEAITIQPAGICRVVAKVLRPEDIGERRQGHRCAGMTGVRFLHGVHRQNPDRVDAEILERLAGARRWGRIGRSGSGRGTGLVGH